ncbi:MAG: DNA polymerase ligase N-terminal domain-containing protein [Spirochaetota bacterium]|nr:DNA polymerase ligase N-terminal domain-containing protein [Spirochaetota bacterium]
MKFVILHHTNGTDHYDLMIEYGKSLLTWHVSTDKIMSLLKGEMIEVERIQNHRKEYLSFEGALSSNRGNVSIFDSGNYEAISFNNERIEITLYGRMLNGKILIKNIEQNIYSICYFSIDQS